MIGQVAGALLAVVATACYCEPALTDPAQTGRLIYRSGSDGTTDSIRAYLGISDTELPATSTPCIDCHGEDGEGVSEMAIRAPALNGTHLTSPLQETSRSRPGYNDDRLAQAIREGVDAGGTPLHPAMPRYRMTKAQMAALLAYLKILGTDLDVDRGIDSDTIHLGSVLPLSGPLGHAGALLRSTLQACMEQINAAGGIYGRKLLLVAEDTGSDRDQGLAATRRLIDQDRVFAILGTGYPETNPESLQALEHANVPAVDITEGGERISEADRHYLFGIAASQKTQSLALVDFLASQRLQLRLPAHPKLLIVRDRKMAEPAVAEEAAQQARQWGWVPLQPIIYGDNQLLERILPAAFEHGAPDVVLYLGNAGDFSSLRRLLSKRGSAPVLLSLLALLGREVFDLPGTIAERTYLASPFSLADGEGVQVLLEVLKAGNVEFSNPGLQALACAAVNGFAEAAKRSGRHLSRAKLIEELERLAGFRAPLLPPLSFSRKQHVGASGAYVVKVNIGKMRFEPVSGWITPVEATRR